LPGLRLDEVQVSESDRQAPPPTGPRRDSVPEPARPWRPTVVSADDDEHLRAFFRSALEPAGFRVLTARNGRGALDIVRRERVDVLLLDLHMPELDGLGALQVLRADPALRTLPVIIVTGSAGESERLAGLDAGADDVIAKPVSVAELVARVRAQIRGHAAMADEVLASREHRRRMATLLSELPRDADLNGLAAALVTGLPDAVDVDGAAILGFAQSGARCIAASPLLHEWFRPGRQLPQRLGVEVRERAAGGPWLRAGHEPIDPSAAGIELAFVPFNLAELASPVACLVYARSRVRTTPLEQRLPDLVDITEYAVAALRPAVEHAATTSAAILDLRQIVARRAFEMRLQPIVQLRSGEVFGFEALTRFDDNVRPDIRFAEATRLGLGRLLERRTIAAAIEAMAAIPPTIALSVNLSPDVLQHERSLGQLLEQAHRPVIVELTEHERIDDYEAIRASLGRLGSGVGLAVDDAGSGYASLKHILSLRPAYVKLDIGWVRGIDQDPVRQSLVSGLAYFAAATKATLIAEGIESEGEQVALINLGVTLGQGFLLGRPVPSDRAWPPARRSEPAELAEPAEPAE
jgi:EAL domain-containing protein (putative c-di-GMP-specific phosphodiesterase class I)/DNA-binding NarL/FixJ family response regulator